MIATGLPDFSFLTERIIILESNHRELLPGKLPEAPDFGFGPSNWDSTLLRKVKPEFA
ncbi:hypothetical protein [Leptospira wolffii]|uniref:hypothetical protein n=1 Tax=Leptospira wolffii TaxID=409998 RepID=UPI00034AB1A3|nr:hypothetical protein [Leptospira wolffii]